MHSAILTERLYGSYDIMFDSDAYNTGNTNYHVYGYDELIQVYVTWNRDGANIPTAGNSRFRLWLNYEDSIITNTNSYLGYGDHVNISVNAAAKTFTVRTDNMYDYKGLIFAVGKNIRKIS